MELIIIVLIAVEVVIVSTFDSGSSFRSIDVFLQAIIRDGPELFHMFTDQEKGDQKGRGENGEESLGI